MATIPCPHCSHSFDLPDDAVGRSVSCPRCEKSFTPPSAAVASGEPPMISSDADGAVTEKAPSAKPRSEWGERAASERRDIARRSSAAVPIVIVSLVVLAGLCICVVPVVLFGFVPFALLAHRDEAMPVARGPQAVAEAPEVGMQKVVGFNKGVADARASIQQNKLLLKEHPPLPAPAWHGDYIKLLKERCNCDYVVIGDPKLPQDQVEEIRGWNETMRAELQARHGGAILDELQAAAEERWRERIKDKKKD